MGYGAVGGRRPGTTALRWNDDEVSALAEHYPIHGGDWEGWRAILPGRTPGSIVQKANHLGIRRIGRSNSWTDDEAAALAEHYPTHGAVWDGWADLLPERTTAAIRLRASQCGIHRRSYARESKSPVAWTDDEVEIIEREYPSYGCRWDGWAALLPGRTPGSIVQKANHLGIRRSKKSSRWTDVELATLAEHYPSHGAEWDGWKDVLTGRNLGAIRAKAGLCGIRMAAPNLRWTKGEDKALRDLYPTYGGSWDGWAYDLPGRTVGAIKARAQSLGIRRDKKHDRSRKGRLWSKGEDAVVEREYPTHGAVWDGWADLLPGRTFSAIAQRATALETLRDSRATWTQEEDDALKTLYPRHGCCWDGWTDVLPGRTAVAIKARARSLGLYWSWKVGLWTQGADEVLGSCVQDRSESDDDGGVDGMDRWSPQEDDVLREFYPIKGADWDGWEVLLPGRSPSSIAARAEAFAAPIEGNTPWSEGEDHVVEELFPIHGEAWETWASVLPGRSSEAIAYRAWELGIHECVGDG